MAMASSKVDKLETVFRIIAGVILTHGYIVNMTQF